MSLCSPSRGQFVMSFSGKKTEKIVQLAVDSCDDNNKMGRAVLSICFLYSVSL